MNSKYKVKPDSDYPMCRQSHLLFSEVGKLDMEEQGFYVNFYGPLAKAIMDNGLFEGYIYHCLSSSTLPKVKAVGTKNKSKVDAFRALDQQPHRGAILRIPGAGKYRGAIPCLQRE